MTKIPVLTLDGPSGVGKGTICLLVAKKLGWHILDSGSLYRLLALSAGDEPDLDNVSQLADLARDMQIEYVTSGDALGIYLRGKNVSQAIRTEATGVLASKVAAIPEVRQALLDKQKAFARAPGLVADGRDMGTTVFPDAELKIFLTASAEERAKRRYKQLKDKGIDANLSQLTAELHERDERDSTRSASPLLAADDAIVIDTTNLSIEQVYVRVMQLVEQHFS
ncbi:MAG: (d)CMP kinase [Gammaproteobacteria bacterium]|nr:(d)CMP kinase [Gammaproteobacteria bacterium]MCW8922285.1 (d)CMP kinase [Gammaproteobacteria bacterium]